MLKKHKKTCSIITVITFIIIVTLTACGQFQTENSDDAEATSSVKTIPNFIGMNYDDILSDDEMTNNYSFTALETQSDEYENNTVILQTPDADTETKETNDKTAITVVISVNTSSKVAEGTYKSYDDLSTVTLSGRLFSKSTINYILGTVVPGGTWGNVAYILLDEPIYITNNVDPGGNIREPALLRIIALNTNDIDFDEYIEYTPENNDNPPITVTATLTGTDGTNAFWSGDAAVLDEITQIIINGETILDKATETETTTSDSANTVKTYYEHDTVELTGTVNIYISELPVYDPEWVCFSFNTPVNFNVQTLREDGNTETYENCTSIQIFDSADNWRIYEGQTITIQGVLYGYGGSSSYRLLYVLYDTVVVN